MRRNFFNCDYKRWYQVVSSVNTNVQSVLECATRAQCVRSIRFFFISLLIPLNALQR